MQTLSEVVRNRSKIEAAIGERGEEGFAGTKLFHTVRMDGVVIFTDDIACRYLEANYKMNTHLVPHRLPGVGLSTGDIKTHEGKTYLTVDFNVMVANCFALHLIRPHEARYVEWTEQAESYNREIKSLIGAVQLADASCFGIKELATFTHTTSPVGWSDVGTPSSELLTALTGLAGHLIRRRKKGMRKLSHTASMLVSRLKPYSAFEDVMSHIRKEAGHKGFPRVHNGMLTLNVPAASGGATLHTHQPSDDLLSAIPSSNDLTLIAAQAGTIPLMHIGAGSLEGEHYFMLPPKSPFFARAQEKLDADNRLDTLWQVLGSRREFASQRVLSEWLKETAPLKGEVIKDVVPGLVAERVLGLHVDLRTQKGTALVRPVVAESHFNAHRDAATHLTAIRPEFSDMLGCIGDTYGTVSSVFKN